MSIGSIFRKFGSFITNLFRGLNPKKVESVARQIFHFADFALPIVEKVAKLTPTPVDDLIIAALKNLNLTAPAILGATSDIFKDGARLTLAAEALRQQLFKLVQEKGRVQIGDFTLTTTADVLKLDGNILRSAAQSAWTIYKLAK